MAGIRDMSANTFQREFFHRLSSEAAFDLLFDLLPEVFFFAKDEQGRFVRMNPALVRAIGLGSESEVLGKYDHDLFPPLLADRYREEDRQVMEQDCPVKNTIWVVPNREGVLTWYLASKIPLHDRSGRVIGIAGAMRDMRSAGAIIGPYDDLKEAIDYMTRHFATEFSVRTLAAMVNLSTSQFERRFRKLFRLSPIQYVIQLRVQNACRQLERTNESISNIALQNGFYDQSAFIRHFRKRLGITPREYRRKAQRTGG